MRGARPLLLSGGKVEAFVDAFEQKVDEELQEAKFPYYVNIKNVYACRRPA